MIDKRFEQYYDIIFSVFIGIVLVLVLNNFYDCPRTIIVDDTNPVSENFRQCHPITGNLW
jgi:hypothetical protein